MSFRRHIILKTNILIGIEELLEDLNFPEILIIFLVILMRMIEVTLILMGGFLWMLGYVAVIFLLIWMFKVMIYGC